MPTVMTPLVVDCYQGEEIKDWTLVRGAGIRGVIHKASEGSNFRDKTYLMRRDRARKAGLLFGGYHFLNDTDIDAQAQNFLDAAQPDAELLLALDYEENKHRTGSLEQARRFLEIIFAKTGQHPVLYSGNLIKEQLKKPDPFFNGHRLWIAHYRDTPTLPVGWDSFWLHQYTGDGSGPGPHSVPGISTQGIDLNVFGGKDLEAEWAERAPINVPVVTTEGEAADALADQPQLPDPPIPQRTPAEKGETIAATAKLTVKGAYGSRTVSALTAFLGVVTGGLKKTFDGATDLFGLAPQAIDQVSDNLTMAEKVSGWMHVSWPEIETTLAIIFIVAAFAFLLHDKAEKARKEA